MPLKLEIKKNLSSRSDRVKCVDLHPDEPWVLAALYNGTVFLWNHETQTLIKSFEVTESSPIRCAKFIARKQWIVTGSDDMMIRVFNYNTSEKVREFEGHVDYIRNLEVHPVQPYLLSTSDDMTIKLWDWEKNWEHTHTFDGHAHYVMMVKFNPKDTNTFASASLDRTVKVWNLGSPVPNVSLEGHERGVNCVDYYAGGDKPYLVSGADDQTIKIWDYQTRSCVQTLGGHTSNVAAVVFHPKLPIIVSGSEDGTVRMWHNTTYRLESTLSYGMERTWSIAVVPGSSKVAIGYDEGTVVIMLGREMPVLSMDPSGKLLCAKNNEITSSVIRGVSQSLADGDPVEIAEKDLGSVEVFPQYLTHNSNGRFVCVCGDGEYIIYTSQALRNKTFGPALDFAWSAVGTGDYAVRESAMMVKIFKNFKEERAFKPPFAAENLFGGHMVAVCGTDFVVFYDWDTGSLVRRIDVEAKKIYWSDSGDMVLIACEDSYYVLECDREVIADAIANGTVEDDGVEGSFDLLHEISETVASGQWVGDCFIYTNTSSRLNYYVGGEVMTLAHLDRPMHVMGFLARENRVFLVDKQRVIVSYEIMESILQYQTAVVRRDFVLANEILPTIPKDNHNEVARFLESQGFKEEALAVSSDPDQRFDLAFQLEKFEVAFEIMTKEIAPAQGNTTDTQSKWKQLGDLALARGNLALAEECGAHASDFGGLLLMYTCTGNASAVKKLAVDAKAAGQTNVAFLSFLLLNDLESCVRVLQGAGRIAEAAFFARTYAPSLVPAAGEAWKEDLRKTTERVANAVALPEKNPELFPEYELALKAEEMLRQARSKSIPATAYSSAVEQLDINVIEMIKSGAIPTPAPAPVAPVPSEPEQVRVVEESPVPVEESPVPVEESPAPVEESPAPVEESPAPVEESPAPVEESPAPVEESPALVEEAPISLEETPASFEDSFEPMSEEPAAVEEAPIAEEPEPFVEKQETTPAAAQDNLLDFGSTEPVASVPLIPTTNEAPPPTFSDTTIPQVASVSLNSQAPAAIESEDDFLGDSEVDDEAFLDAGIGDDDDLLLSDENENWE